jgi:hypothetical protein
MSLAMFRVPSAWLPLAMSGMALVILAAQVLTFGAAHEADEGAAAHLWQLFMAGQVPLIAWFVVRWLPRSPQLAIQVLAAQVVALAIAAAPVALLRL